MSEVKDELCFGAKVQVKNQYSTHFEQNYNVDGSPSSVDLESIFNAPQDNIETIVGYSKYCYRKYGLIMRTVNIYRDFGANGLMHKYPKKSEKIKKIIDDYEKRINIKQFIRDCLMELALTGNLACYDRVNRIEIYPINKIEVLPLVINNKQVIAYKVDEDSLNTNDYGEKYNKMIEEAYPKEILDAKRKGNEFAILDMENSHFVKINSSQYERYGVSVILPAFEDLAHKSLLKETERAVANDVIDKIMMIQIGNEEVKPSKALIDGYSELFSNAHGSVRFTVPYYVDAKFVEPETTIFGREKFLEVDTDILNTLGISLSLLRGSDGSNYADGILNFSGLCRTIENIREPIVNVIYELYQAELKRNGCDPENAPIPYFEDVVIDKEAKVSLMMELFQNAGLPYEVLYEEAGLDFDHIKLVRKNENEEDMDTTFKNHVIPFTGMDSGQDDEQDNPNAQQDDEGGRPKTPESQRKTDKSQSNNKQPRTGTKGTLRGNSAKKPAKQ